MFSRFNPVARRIIVLAQEEAWSLKHAHVGSEHMLLASLSIADVCVAGYTLKRVDVEYESVRATIVDIVGEGTKQPSGNLPFTPRAKTIMELSLRAALQLGDNFIGSGHLLLGLLREAEGVGYQVLGKFASPEDVKMKTRAVMAEVGFEEFRVADLKMAMTSHDVVEADTGFLVVSGPFATEEAARAYIDHISRHEL